VVLACSEVDARTFRRLRPDRPVVVVPNVVDVEGDGWAGEGEAATLLYQGGLDWYPNRDAVWFFASRVLPHIRRAVPAARLVVAGRNPSAGFARRLARVPGVELAGPVEDMRTVLRRASLSVVPLRIGSGTRLKILEAAAAARAVVSTRLGAEGLGFVDGEEIVLADEPEALADAVVRLLGAPGRRAAMGRAAQRRVEQDYSLDVLVRGLARALDRVAPASRAPSRAALASWEPVAP
jgi:glycosyltransferase involved in cell wall biosynthesis